MASQTLTGALHVYDAANQLAYFESGDVSGTNTLLFVPGVGAGLGSLAVLPKLSQSLPPGWGLVQATTRSSYAGWLSTGGDRVAEDILALERHLRTQAGKTGRLALMGHSKGCSDVVEFFNLHGQTTTIDSAILVSINSGREHLLRLVNHADLEASLSAASSQIKAGLGSLPFSPHLHRDLPILAPLPGIHAEIWYAAMAPGGSGDRFASYSSDEELREVFAGMRENGKRVCVFMAGEDEVVPGAVEKEVLLARFKAAAMGAGGEPFVGVLKGSGHVVADEAAQEQLIGELVEFLGGAGCASRVLDQDHR